ncbi:hypothetical protein H6P81_015767 [Aristolochia fimbriata]|uniref:U-box domain-containing protein n=1 Tax=Aristolochia fimbriata TaxID=158543 RepID=A0AAV7E6J5_ARIFI|nr:hypothetical protein H6P81_015767 [Aristolochia fimbriata]
MDEIEIPHYFLCPISLELMRDPVTVSTGITYDRQSIERWMFSGPNNSNNKGKKTCPVTKQAVHEELTTPNHTLRRLIQAWCTANASSGIERIPTPRPPVDKTHILNLIANARVNPHSHLLPALQKLKSIASESDRNKRCIESAPGALSFLASLVIVKDDEELPAARAEALSVLHHLQLTDDGLRELLYGSGADDLISSLTDVLRRSGSCTQSRVYAIFLLKSILAVFDPVKLVSMRAETLVEVVRVLRHQISSQATKAALQILIEVCPWGRNRMKAVESGAVSVLIELLLTESSSSTGTSTTTATERLPSSDKKRCTEMTLVVLDQLCGCADGRAEFLSHAAGLAVVSKKMLRVSGVATERAVKIVSSIARYSATPAVLQEMLQVGVVSKLCLVVQVNCSLKAREKAKDILALHSKAWTNSPCVPLNFTASS